MVITKTYVSICRWINKNGPPMNKVGVHIETNNVLHVKY